MDYFQTYYALVVGLLIIPTISAYVYYTANSDAMIALDKAASPMGARLVMWITGISAFFGFPFVVYSGYVVGGIPGGIGALVTWSVIVAGIGNQIEFNSKLDHILYFLAPLFAIAAWVVFFINA